MKRLKIAGVLVLSTVIAVGYSIGNVVHATVPGVNELISVNNTGNGQGGNATTYDYDLQPRSSSDGNLVVFTTGASNIVSGDTNNKKDVFLRNISSDTTIRISISTSGVQANGDSETWGAISRTGRYVAFTSRATNLIDGRTISTATTVPQVYVRDTVANTTELVTENSSGVAGASTYGSSETYWVNGVSSDGRFVVFQGHYTNLGPTASADYRHLYLADRQNDTFTILSNPLSGEPAFDGTVGMSCDGSLIVFSTARQMISSDTNNTGDIYLIDLRNGVSYTAITASGTDGAGVPTISCNGDYVGFVSDEDIFSSGLVSPTDVNNHAYMYDRIRGEFQLLDYVSTSTVANKAAAYVSISDDADAVFVSLASNLASGTTGTSFQAYLRHADTGVVELLSRNASGVVGNKDSMHSAIIPSGKYAIVQSQATNLITSDTNAQWDVFRFETGL